MITHTKQCRCPRCKPQEVKEPDMRYTALTFEAGSIVGRPDVVRVELIGVEFDGQDWLGSVAFYNEKCRVVDIRLIPRIVWITRKEALNATIVLQ